MSTEAIIMFLIGAVLLWGGLALSVVIYVRAARRDDGSATGG
ncbi:MAG: hypothetical protein AVDCRST_MAG34-337 [uncultured Nocardioidaceae bacterium]|uniref:MetS family NSS transporter small subunit n=1 Tax=uncultured Nocardioidaceae bacterium TaxID=253824 RepID=A0A6J4L935_9ACTN|nr:MAG: hypothetical protein AVDCRST_MAG34-337 [uncultured Nocardioidaceae bacterium]